jgi:hypothetical protein
MKGTVAYIINNVKPLLNENGFINTKNIFEKNIKLNYNIKVSIISVNFLEFQDIELGIFLYNQGKERLMNYLDNFYYNQPSSHVISFKITQFDKMQNEFWGGFKNEKYWISNKEEADDFIYDLKDFLNNTLFTNKIDSLIQIDIIENLLNKPEVFTSSVIKDVDYSRFYDGLIYSKLSNSNNLDQVFEKYWSYTKGWNYEAKNKILKVYDVLKNSDKNKIETIYYEN